MILIIIGGSETFAKWRQQMEGQGHDQTMVEHFRRGPLWMHPPFCQKVGCIHGGPRRFRLVLNEATLLYRPNCGLRRYSAGARMAHCDFLSVLHPILRWCTRHRFDCELWRHINLFWLIDGWVIDCRGLSVCLSVCLSHTRGCQLFSSLTQNILLLNDPARKMPAICET